MNGTETFQMLEYLRAVRRRWKLVVLFTVVVFVVALGVSFSLQKQYDATVELLLREPEQVNALLNPGASTGSTEVERDLNTNVQLIKNENTAQVVRERLGLDRSTTALLKQVETKINSTSNIVGLTVRDPDRKIAARIANAFAEAYVQFRITSARRRYTQAAELAKNQLLALGPSERSTAEARDLQSRQRELEIAAALQTGGAEIVRPASAPIAPSRPRPALNGALGLIVGALVGIAIALALELVDRRLKDEDAVEDFFQLPVLAAIPRARRGGGLDHHAQSEVYGLLAANLRLSAPKAGSSVVLITSASPGEGKTTVSVGVARACARLGLRAVVIEADLRRPTFSRFANVSFSQGLTAVLAGSSTLAEELIWLDSSTMQPVHPDAEDEGMVGMLPAGPLPINPQRVLSQPAMRTLVEEASSLGDIVLIDTAPAGTVNDPLTMARLVDGVVMVARLDMTTKDAARRALRVLRNVDVELTGVVITNAAATERYGYYGAAPSAGPEPVAHAQIGAVDQRD